MTRIAILLQFFILLGTVASVEVNAQELINLRSTLSIGGTSGKFTDDGKHYAVQQSIGQASVIDSYQVNGFLLRQGFIQPIKGLNKKTVNKNLIASISPNPFSSNISIKFSEKVFDKLYVTLTNLQGIVLYSDAFEKSQELNLNLGHLSSGFYIIKVNSGNKCFVSKVIKE
mgnify:CR=1 FL=1